MKINNKVSSSLKEKKWTGLILTNSAIIQIHHLMQSNPTIFGIRVRIRKFGCAGFGYIMEKVSKIRNSDLVYDYDGIKLYVEQQAMPFIDGTKLDYIKEGLNYMFKFSNPKAVHVCGCGESFNLEDIKNYEAEQS